MEKQQKCVEEIEKKPKICGRKQHKMFRLFLVIICFAWTTTAELKIFDVKRYGAIADGKSDNSKALLKAWREACAWKGTGAVLVPTGEYMVHPVTFKGPCNGKTLFLNGGVILGPTHPSLIHALNWITFERVHRLRVAGGGVFDGQGPSVWHYNDCHKNSNCRRLSSSIAFKFVSDSRIDHITSINSKLFHFNIYDDENINISNVRISAPDHSPNTDGIHIGRATNIRVTKSVIATGDDCISLKQGSRNIHISQVQCGPGHGISIGSLGMNQDEENVIDVDVRNCTFVGSDNGLRIKTWASPHSNIASDFNFEDIRMKNVRNPIVIDQVYCPHPPCSKGHSEVEISNVKFRNIRGTSSSKIAVSLICSKRFPCTKIQLNDINLVYKGEGGPATSSCQHVKGVVSGIQRPPSCI